MRPIFKKITVSLFAVSASAIVTAQAAEYPVFKVESQAINEDQLRSMFKGLSQTAAQVKKLPQSKMPEIKKPVLNELQKVRPQIQPEQLKKLAPSDLKFSKGKNTLKLKEDRKILEVDQRSGFHFAADMDHLWNIERSPKLVSDKQGVEISKAYLEKYNLLPKESDYTQISLANISGTFVGDDVPGKIDKQQLDQIITYKIDMKIDGRMVPIVGGGNEFAISLGDQGKVISYQGGWRPIQEVVDTISLPKKEEVLGQYEKDSPKTEFRNLDAYVAYYAAPGFRGQEFLSPVWVVTGEIQSEKDIIPIRPQIISFSKYGPKFLTGEPAKGRKKIKETESRKMMNGDEERGEEFGLMDLFISKAYAQQAPLECGASWIGESQGLGGSQGNRQGFLNGCRDMGWRINFDWGNQAAFESDWRRNDDLYLDAADLVFYTGHAGPRSWNLFNPDDTSFQDTEDNGAQDLWGNLDLEWLIIAACGPLQSTHFTTNTTNAFDRWRDVFDGLHTFMGYGAVTFDNTEEGERFMELAEDGWSVIDAWFRTARDIQPATNTYSPPNGNDIFVVAMYAHNGDHCTRNEPLHGRGTVCPDVTGSGQQRYLMWSGT